MDKGLKAESFSAGCGIDFVSDVEASDNQKANLETVKLAGELSGRTKKCAQWILQEQKGCFLPGDYKEPLHLAAMKKTFLIRFMQEKQTGRKA